jgi:hypothetical protein
MKLKELAPVIRSKNAGPYWYTIDIIFDSLEIYTAMKKANVITTEIVANLYHTPIENVSDIIFFDEGRAIKFNIKRPHVSGSLFDTDVLGMQQHAPMLEIDLPLHKVIGQL